MEDRLWACPPSCSSREELQPVGFMKGLGMETSPPDTPEPAPRGQAEVVTLPPDQAWRFEAPCNGADVNDFMILDAEELGVPRIKVASLNKSRLALTREKFCDHCPFVAPCNESAVFEGSHVWSLRGGITPYEREGITAGRPVPDGIFRANAEADTANEVRRMLQGKSMDGEAGKYARRAYLREVSEGPQTAFWGPHEVSWSRNPQEVVAGSGWALSQDLTGYVLMVAHRTGVGLRTRFVLTSHTEFDREGTPRLLVEGYPDGVMLPKVSKRTWKNKNLPVESKLASPPRAWLD